MMSIRKRVIYVTLLRIFAASAIIYDTTNSALRFRRFNLIYFMLLVLRLLIASIYTYYYRVPVVLFHEIPPNDK